MQNVSRQAKCKCSICKLWIKDKVTFFYLGNHEISIKKSLTSGKLARIKSFCKSRKYNYYRFVYIQTFKTWSFHYTFTE